MESSISSSFSQINTSRLSLIYVTISSMLCQLNITHSLQPAALTNLRVDVTNISAILEGQGQAKVANAGSEVILDEHVLALEVAMSNSWLGTNLLVEECEAAQHCLRNSEQALPR